MGIRAIMVASAAILICATASSGPLASGVEEKKLVIRQAMQDTRAVVGVEAYLLGEILEVTVVARMDKAKPEIHKVLVVGPKLGRENPIEVRPLFATTQTAVEEDYETVERGAFIRFSDKKKTKEIKGRATRELYKFKIPPEKIKKDGKYELWVKIENPGQKGRILSYKFDLDLQ